MADRDPRLVENDRRVDNWVRRILDAPLPQPKDPRKSRVFWAIVWYAAGAVSVVVFLVTPGALR